MIRKLQKSDIERVAQIWLETNVEAHGFIPEAYWKDNFATVKEDLMQAEVYIYAQENRRESHEEEMNIEGFIGLMDTYVAGIFVCKRAQSGGIGKQLLDYVKKIKGQLKLKVYQKNTRAVSFYLREGFCMQSEGIDKDTGEKEYRMEWREG